MATIARSIEPGIVEEAPDVGRLPARKHVLDLDDFTQSEIERVLQTTMSMKEVLRRDIKKVPPLRGKVVMTLFYEASTRTRISFEEAGKVLSAEVINMSGSGSSVEKGESLLNTALTLQAMGADIIVMRHPHAGAPNFVARSLQSVSIINAGDGLHAHPTQALLDLYTIKERLGRIAGLKVVIVGDVLHSRVARSNLWGMTAMGARVTLCGPPTLLPQEMLRSPVPSFLPVDRPGNVGERPMMPPVEVETDLDRALDGADVVMALRLQEERQSAGFLPSLREYTRRWQVTQARLERAQPHVLVMHPGPLNEGIELAPGLAHGERSAIEEQVANGVAVRMALLYMLAAPKA